MKQKFISMMYDITYKTLWLKGNKDVKKYLDRINEYILGYDISDYTLSSNELGITNYKSKANRIDILLVNEKPRTRINIELNNGYYKSLENKNLSYIFKIGGEFYSKEDKKYKEVIKVEQINLNGYFNKDNRDIIELHYELYDKKNKKELKNLKIHHIFLPKIKELCYDEGEKDIYKDFAMFMCESYEEMEEIAKGNKEREKVMEELKKLGSDKEFVDYYDHEEYEKALKEEIEETSYNDGFEQGEKNILKKFYESGMDLEDIAKYAKLDITEVEKIIK